MSLVNQALGAARRRLPYLAPAVLVMALGLAFAGQGLWIDAKAVMAQVLLERAFDRSLATGRPVKPWPWADTWPVARISFPRQGRSVIALETASGQAMAFGPGHLAGSPDPGDPGVAIFAAHRDTHFAVLGQVKAGDPIDVVRRDGAMAHFQVVGSRIVRWDRSGIDPHAAGRTLILATCWPLNARRHGPERYIVIAKLKQNDQSTP